MREPVIAYLALGANLGDAQAGVRVAIEAIAGIPGCRLRQRSSLYRTAPVDAGGPDYINAVVEIDTTLTAPALLQRLQALELQAGRERPYRHAPRTLDIDILLFGNAVMRSEALELPHPRMWRRAFVLVPLAQIAPQRVSAEQLQKVANQACERLPD